MFPLMNERLFCHHLLVESFLVALLKSARRKEKKTPLSIVVIAALPTAVLTQTSHHGVYANKRGGGVKRKAA